MNKIIPYIKLIQSLKENSPLKSVQLNLTTECGGMKCLTCKRSLWPHHEIDYSILKKLFIDLNTIGVETVYVTGGDPLFYKYFYEIITSLKFNLKIGVVTTAAFKNINWKH